MADVKKPDLRIAAFFLALNAWSWAVAFAFHATTWGDTTIDKKLDGSPLTHQDGEPVTTWTPRWYCFPLIGNLLGGYVGFIIYATRTWG